MTASLDDVYRTHADELIRYATTLVGPDEASDVVTDAVVRVLERRGDDLSSDAHNVRAYLFRSVYNRSIDVLRSRSRRRRREVVVALREPVRSHDANLSIDARRAIAQLSEQQCTVAFLTFWCDHSTADIASFLDVSEGTVRKQLARARARLVEILDA